MVYGTAFCPLAMKDAVKDLGVAGKCVNGYCGVLYLEYCYLFLLQILRL